jgi:hypothetical protein
LAGKSEFCCGTRQRAALENSAILHPRQLKGGFEPSEKETIGLGEERTA